MDANIVYWPAYLLGIVVFFVIVVAFFQIWFGIRSINREAKKQTRLLAQIISNSTDATVHEILELVDANIRVG